MATPAQAVEPFSTVIRNKTSRTLTLSFLPPHGRRVGPHAQFEVRGDLIDHLRRSRDLSRFRAMQAAIEGGVIEILKSPSPVYFDPITGRPHILAVSNNAVVIAGVPTDFNESSLASLGAGNGVTAG